LSTGATGGLREKSRRERKDNIRSRNRTNPVSRE